MTVRTETLTAHLPRTRWAFIPGTLLVIWVVGMLDKIGVAVTTWPATTTGVFGLATWFPTYMSKSLHLNSLASSNYIALAFGLCLILTPIAGAVTDRIQRKALWNVAGFLVAAITLGVVATVGTVAAGLAGLIVAILGIEGITTLIGQGIVHGFTRARNMGRDNGIIVGIANVIAAFGPTIMGALVGLSGFSLASCSSSASSSLAYLRPRACTARGTEPGREAMR
jgi:MFS family permease